MIIDPEAVAIDDDDGRFQIYRIPAAKIAYAVGSIKCLNAVVLGGLTDLLSELVSRSDLLKALEASVPPKTLKINLSAFEMGRKYIEDNYSRVS